MLFTQKYISDNLPFNNSKADIYNSVSHKTQAWQITYKDQKVPSAPVRVTFT